MYLLLDALGPDAAKQKNIIFLEGGLKHVLIREI